MAERRLDKQTMDVVKRAWASLSQRYQQDSRTEEYHWTDNEGDVGFLKDVDAMNALVEPFLLSPSSFVDPPLRLEEVASRLAKLLEEIRLPNKVGEGEKILELYLGFSAAPYPYIQLEVDFVDSASAVLRLICNVAKLYAITKQQIPTPLEKRMSQVSILAVEFLLQARIEDRLGVRWSGFSRRIDTAGKFANLFFTNCAAMALHNALETSGVKNWIAQQREQTELVLGKVTNWVASQYDPATNGFWMDEPRTQTQTMGVLYALEVLYTVPDSPLTEDLRANCAKALTAVVEKMTELANASSLQRDFFHSLPLPSGPGITFYDDRKYIGAFLSLLTLAKAKDPNIVGEAFIQAGNVLFSGVSDEWIDEPTRLWDDGRPLICFSQDALLGLVNYFLEGKVDTINLGENDLRFAIRDTLKSDEVVDAVFNVLLEKARGRKEKELSRTLNAAGSKTSLK